MPKKNNPGCREDCCGPTGNYCGWFFPACDHDTWLVDCKMYVPSRGLYLWLGYIQAGARQFEFRSTNVGGQDFRFPCDPRGEYTKLDLQYGSQPDGSGATLRAWVRTMCSRTRFAPFWLNDGTVEHVFFDLDAEMTSCSGLYKSVHAMPSTVPGTDLVLPSMGNIEITWHNESVRPKECAYWPDSREDTYVRAKQRGDELVWSQSTCRFPIPLGIPLTLGYSFASEVRDPFDGSVLVPAGTTGSLVIPSEPFIWSGSPSWLPPNHRIRAVMQGNFNSFFFSVERLTFNGYLTRVVWGTYADGNRTLTLDVNSTSEPFHAIHRAIVNNVITSDPTFTIYE